MTHRSEDTALPVIRTWEMIAWLQQTKDIPEELGEAFLAAWVSVIRHAVLTQAEKQPEAVNPGVVPLPLEESALDLPGLLRPVLSTTAEVFPAAPARGLGGQGSSRPLLNRRALLSLSLRLVPEGWSDGELEEQIIQQTGLTASAAEALLTEVSAKLRTSGDRVMFEPVGLFQSQPSAEGGGSSSVAGRISSNRNLLNQEN